jgi:hypothetical protein
MRRLQTRGAHFARLKREFEPKSLVFALVPLDRAGIVRLFHSGRITYEELRAQLESMLK